MHGFICIRLSGPCSTLADLIQSLLSIPAFVVPIYLANCSPLFFSRFHFIPISISLSILISMSFSLFLSVSLSNRFLSSLDRLLSLDFSRIFRSVSFVIPSLLPLFANASVYSE